MESFQLNNGNTIPSLGLGTFTLKPKEAESAVTTALKAGIRLIDTANAYMNEKAVGRAIQNSSIDRKDIYVSTKLWPSVYGKNNAIDQTVKRLKTDYIDLLFLHQPVGNWKQAYQNMEKAYQAGTVRALGLSNFPLSCLKEVIEKAKIKPQVVQVECHPYDQQKELKEYLKAQGICLMAWYPLGHGDSHLLNEPVLKAVSEKYHKTTVQILLRWHIQSGNIVIPGSKNPQHIQENADIFDFSLSDCEMKQIDQLDKNEPYFKMDLKQMEKFAKIKIPFNLQR